MMEIFTDEINLSNLTKNSGGKFTHMKDDFSLLNSLKQQILDITSQRGHTKKELTFWGKIQIIFKAIANGVENVLGERHEASKLEFLGNLFHYPTKLLKLSFQVKLNMPMYYTK